MNEQLGVVVVTGATGAIGRATVALLREQGGVVAALGRNQETLDQLAFDTGAHPWRVDVRDDPALTRVADEIANSLGPVSSLLTFAGGNGHPVPSVTESLDHWRDVVDAELTSTFATIRAFVDQLTSHPSSSIITMASSAGLRASGSSAAYAAAKAGVIGLTRHLAGELRPQGVRVNCIAPSAVDNDRFAIMPSEHRRAMEARLPLGRLGTPREVAEAALYLASARSSFTTGAVLELGGPTL